MRLEVFGLLAVGACGACGGGGTQERAGTPTAVAGDGTAPAMGAPTAPALVGGPEAGAPLSAMRQSTGGQDAAVVAQPPAPPPTPPPDPCIAANNCAPGVWVNVTPPNVNLTTGACGNYGTETVQVDPQRPEDLYTLFMCQGIWKSTDYGETWNGPINTGTNGAAVGDCAGGITIPPASTASPPIIYESCIRGNGNGFWRSLDGGVNWTNYNVAPGGARQDFYPASVDPYDATHLIMAGHEMNVLVQSTDGGQTWTAISTVSGMNENGGTAAINFIDTGNAGTTRKTWLWIAQASGGIYGTWRTSDGGSTWTQVDTNEHIHGSSQIYQPAPGPIVYMAGAYSAYGWGVVRSADYGVTWAHEGMGEAQTIVVGTPKFVYSMHGGAAGVGQMVDPTLEMAPQPGTGTWTAPGTPMDMTQGPAQAAVTSDKTHEIIVTASWNAGLWRYLEPTN